MGVGGTGQVAHHAGQVKFQDAGIDGAGQAVGPEAGGPGVGLHQGHLRRLATGEAQIIEGLAVDIEHGRGGAVFRAHVGNGGAVADGQAGRPRAEKLDVGPHYPLLAQELGQGEDDVGGGDARLALARELDADDVRQAHHGGATEHHRLRLQAADADGDDA